ncbi:PH domain-containing protein [Microbulbifer pacificus]|uniref:PH domain-containing protein n=1 Tax=Microbulbifer pacificus TaxID=407164 RepID=A0AAU0MZA5_9GAMM|nr:PH domain-containing protein [Microbulbifer pacificus]WOX06037.1 PH domain-containing protein [Microbulbifer pacificus]
MPSSPNIARAIEFSAPWSRQLTFITLLTSVILLGISTILWLKAPENPPLMYQLSIWMCPGVLLLSALFAVRGYRVQGRNLWVLRPGWKTRIVLNGLKSVSFEPDATKGSIRLFGNGGFFAFSGLFRNQKLGRYRAFATDMSHTVVIQLPARTIVVTPDKPEQFQEALSGLTESKTG